MKHRHLFINCFKTIIFWVILLTVLWYTQEVLKQKFIGDSTSIVNGFYVSNEEMDAVFIGPSSSFCTIMPKVLYDEYGINAYVMGSSAQTLDISYVYLQEVLKYQKPQIIVLDVARIKIPKGLQRDGEQAKRWGFTDLKLSFSKIAGIYHSCNGVNEEFWTYVFPILRFKDRINELTAFDFTYVFMDKTSPTGGYMGSEVITEEKIDICYLNENDDAGCFDIHSADIEALNKIVKLCNKNNVKLVLFKSPVDTENWDGQYFNAVKKFARNYSLMYIDCGTAIDEIGLDELVDFRDKAHCNDSGAKKVTSYLGEKLWHILDGEKVTE